MNNYLEALNRGKSQKDRADKEKNDQKIAGEDRRKEREKQAKLAISEEEKVLLSLFAQLEQAGIRVSESQMGLIARSGTGDVPGREYLYQVTEEVDEMFSRKLRYSKIWSIPQIGCEIVLIPFLGGMECDIILHDGYGHGDGERSPVGGTYIFTGVESSSIQTLLLKQIEYVGAHW